MIMAQELMACVGSKSAKGAISDLNPLTGRGEDNTSPRQLTLVL